MSNTAESAFASEKWLDVVRAKVGLIRYGSVQITVHDGRVTQIESIEKTRIGGDEVDGRRPENRPSARSDKNDRSAGPK
jgi:hypothetical protein